MLKYFCTFALLLVYCSAESPVIKPGTCPNIVPQPNYLLTVIDKLYYEIGRFNNGTDRTQWCDKEYIGKINCSAATFQEIYYDNSTGQEVRRDYILTGQAGYFTLTHQNPSYHFQCKTLLFTCHLWVLYCCNDVGDNTHIDRVYAYLNADKTPSEYERLLIQRALDRYGLGHYMVDSIQNAGQCSQLTRLPGETFK